MAYVDLAATEARGRYSPPNGNDPQTIPDLWRPAPGEEVRTDLPDLTDAELNALDWKGPIQMPPFAGTSYFTHDYRWNKETREYDVTEISECDKQKRVQYQKFWDLLMDGVPLLDENGEIVKTDGIVFKKIKTASTQSLLANTLATEFIALMSDAKNGQANIEKIQEVLTEIVSGIVFNAEELAEIQAAFTQSGMFSIYTLE
jgi:hypothetical protein